MQLESSWEKYYLEYKKLVAQGAEPGSLQYGEKIYTSPTIPSYPDNGSSVNVCWQVLQFGQEFNVFCDRFIGGKESKKFVTSFRSKEPALRFALEMLLVCAGKLRRNGLVAA